MSIDNNTGENVRLSDFIKSNSEAILAEWVAFASASVPATENMDHAGIRDHALEMLRNIVLDLQTPQTASEQSEKSMGLSDRASHLADTAAQIHGSARAESGFTHAEMVSEYRALRASVIRLWTKAKGTLTGADVDDLVRFNEAIDQALAESVARYARDLDQSKEMFIAILGHDLRTPIGAVLTSSQFMIESEDLQEPHLTLAQGIARSASRMSQMVADLLDFTRSRLGSGVPITRTSVDIGHVVREAVAEMMNAEPGSLIGLNMSGDLVGCWDAGRISQVLTNLLSNAVQHGRPGAQITVALNGEGDDVVLSVHNYGRPIPAADMPGLFSPLKRLHAEPVAEASHHLGLGLYIVDRIVSAHCGTINVESSEDGGTQFTVRLPRNP